MEIIDSPATLGVELSALGLVCDIQTKQEVDKFVGLLEEVLHLNGSAILSASDIHQIVATIKLVHNVYVGQVREREKLLDGGPTPVFLHKIRSATISLMGFLLLHKSLKTGEMTIFAGIDDKFINNALVVYQECAKNGVPGILRDHVLYRLGHDVPEDGRGLLLPTQNISSALQTETYNQTILTNKRTELNEQYADALVTNINELQKSTLFQELRMHYAHLIPNLHRFLLYGAEKKEGRTVVSKANLEGTGFVGLYQDIYVADAMLLGETGSPASGWGIERVRICTDISMSLYYLSLRESGVEPENAAWVINRIAKVTTVKYGALSLTDEQQLIDQIKSNPGMMLGKLGDVLDNLRSLGTDPEIQQSGYLEYKLKVRQALIDGKRYPSYYELMNGKIPVEESNNWASDHYAFSSIGKIENKRKFIAKIEKYEGYLSSIHVLGYGWVDFLIPVIYNELGMGGDYNDNNLVKINIDILGLQEKKNNLAKTIPLQKAADRRLINGFTEMPDALDPTLLQHLIAKGARQLSKISETTTNSNDSIDLYDSITLLDLYQTKDWSKKMIAQILGQVDGINITDLGNDRYNLDARGIIKVNQLFNDAVQKYLYELHAVDRIPKIFTQQYFKKYLVTGRFIFKGFKSFEDVYKFMNDDKHSKVMQRIRCSLLKLTYVKSVIDQNNTVVDQNENFFEFVKGKFIPLLRVVPAHKQQGFDEFVHKYSSIQDKSPEDYAEFNKKFLLYSFTLRVKSGEDKMFLDAEVIPLIEFRKKLDKDQEQKLIADPNYNMLDALKDIYGMRIHVYGNDQGLKVAEYFWKHLFNKKATFGDKNFFKDKEKFKTTYKDSGFDPYFLFNMSEAIGDEKSQKSSNAFQGTDLTGDVEGLDKKLEIQIVYRGNVNETKGTSHRGIYEAKKNIREMMRLEGYVSKMYMRDILRIKTREYYQDLYKYGGGDEDKAVDYFFNIISQEKGLFSELSIENKKYYVLTDRWQELDFWHLLPVGSPWTIKVGGTKDVIDGNNFLMLKSKLEKINTLIGTKLTKIMTSLDGNFSKDVDYFIKISKILQQLDEVLSSTREDIGQAQELRELIVEVMRDLQ